LPSSQLNYLVAAAPSTRENRTDESTTAPRTFTQSPTATV
jgi:hypothetical protein